MELRSPFRIGAYEIVPMSGQIIGPKGETRVQPKVVDVLLYLAENAGEVVEREAILQRVWGQAIVTDDSLTRCISELRRAFGEQRGKHQYLQTVSKRGYKLLQPVSPGRKEVSSQNSSSGNASHPDSSRGNAESNALAIPPTDTPTVAVAVLPFENLSQNPEHGFIGEALVMELQNSLSQLHRVRLSSQRSSAALQKDDVSPEVTANRLGIQYLISGSVQCTAKRIRVIAQLENPREGTMLWSDTYDADIDDVLAVERNVAGAIAGAFGGERLKMEIRGAKSRSKTDLDAWGLVQRARHYLINYDLDALTDAISFLERAVEIDENYAAAHAMLGSVISEKVINCVSEDPDADRAKARELVERASSLEPQDSFVIRMAGCVFAYCGDYGRSIRFLRRAVKAFDHDLGAWGYMGWPLIASGRPEDLAELKTILARLMESALNHPGAVYWRYHQSVVRTAEEDYAGAAEDVRSVIDEQPKFALGWMHYANVLGYLNQADAVREAVTRCEASNPAMTPAAYASLMSSLTDQEDVVQMRTGGLRAAGLI